ARSATAASSETLRLRVRESESGVSSPGSLRRNTGVGVLLAGGLTAASGGLAQASALHCGDVITVNTRLASDLVNCPDNGLVIGADNITLDLNGHVIDGDGTRVPSCPPDATCDTGVDNTAGHSHVTVKGGSIRQFNVAVWVFGGAGDHIRHLAVAHTTVGIIATHTPTPGVPPNL